MPFAAVTPLGSVEITYPDPNLLRAMCNGGGLLDPDQVGAETDRQVEGGIDADVARQWTEALCRGGHVTATALDLIRRRDIPKDRTGVTLVDTLPDRWFRNAWRQAFPCGPLHVDLQAAMQLQGFMIAHQRELLERQVREQEVMARLLRWNENPADILGQVDEEISRLNLRLAESPEHLKTLWPLRLPKPKMSFAPRRSFPS